jgi:uncharacterized 2Fe-2S/4Fe-4S cluster protein (DUF4445 family)
MKRHEVLFQPEGIRVLVAAGQTVMEAANEAGIILNNACGGAGVCRKCAVELDGGGETVLACQCRVERDLGVTVPVGSRFFAQKILQTGLTPRAQVNPTLSKYSVQLEAAHLKDLRGDLARLIDAVNEQREETPGIKPGASEKAVQKKTWPRSALAMPPTVANDNGLIDSIAPTALAQLPEMLRTNDYRLTAVCRGGRIIAIEPGDTQTSLYGMAVDVGTTTVVAYLVNLADGRVVATAAETNPQIPFGDDVISRIEYTRLHEHGLHRLHRCIVDGVNGLIERLVEQAGIKGESIYEVTAAGNTTMQHLLAGVPVLAIAQAPYVSVFSSGITLRAGDLGLNVCREADVYLLPGVAAHVGGDAAAVAMSVGLGTLGEMTEKTWPRSALAMPPEITENPEKTIKKHGQDGHATAAIALDIGTNGEIVMAGGGRLAACSTAAGPAFEGARIHQGMRGAAGAIERVVIRGDHVEHQTIGGGKPVGICGSGLIDAIAEMLNAGILDSSGRLSRGEDLLATVGPAIRDRVIDYQGAPAFMLAAGDETQHGRPIVLTQRDIREAQLGKAAIAAGMSILMKHLGIELDSVERIYLAGAFGNYIRPENARRIGLLPAMGIEKIQFVGNAAGTGAIEVLCSRDIRRYNECLASRIEYVELAGREEFMRIFSDSMFFPER